MTQTAGTQFRNVTGTPIAPVLADRWSPRGFDKTHEISQDELLSIIEAARWAPSAGNTQPWAFIAARRGTPEFDAIASALAGFNKIWAGSASALIVFSAVPDRGGKMTRWINYDVGQAAANALSAPPADNPTRECVGWLLLTEHPQDIALTDTRMTS